MSVLVRSRVKKKKDTVRDVIFRRVINQAMAEMQTILDSSRLAALT